MKKNINSQKDTATTRILCIVISIFTIITIVVGVWLKNSYWIIAGIIPAAIYEAWRTEGYYTKAASIGIVVLVILEILAIMGIIRFNISQFFNTDTFYFSGFLIPLGDIVSIFPIVCALLALILLRRTYGPYTKWLSILLIVSALALLYVVNKSIIPELIKNSAGSYYWLY